jgi:hypothetical protein
MQTLPATSTPCLSHMASPILYSRLQAFWLCMTCHNTAADSHVVASLLLSSLLLLLLLLLQAWIQLMCCC